MSEVVVILLLQTKSWEVPPRALLRRTPSLALLRTYNIGGGSSREETRLEELLQVDARNCGGSSRKETHLEKLHNKLPLAEAEARLARNSPREAVASVYYLAEVQ